MFDSLIAKLIQNITPETPGTEKDKIYRNIAYHYHKYVQFIIKNFSNFGEEDLMNIVNYCKLTIDCQKEIIIKTEDDAIVLTHYYRDLYEMYEYIEQWENAAQACQKAIVILQQVISTSTPTASDYGHLGYYYNSLGIFYEKLNKLHQAQQALHIAVTHFQNALEKARVTNNQPVLAWLPQQLEKACQDLTRLQPESETLTTAVISQLAESLAQITLVGPSSQTTEASETTHYSLQS